MKKKMKNNNTTSRFGGAVVIILVVLVVIGLIAGSVAGYFYNSGKDLQTKQSALWAEAFTLFSQKQPEAAYLKLIDVRNTFADSSLDFYHKFSKDSHITKAEVNEAIVLICQSEAYDNLFQLQSAKSWLDKARAEVEYIEDKEAKDSYLGFIDRAAMADKYCSQYQEYSKATDLDPVKYQSLVKDSLKAGNSALKDSDYDYTIFEIRFLIACGKTFNEPILINEARQQLFEVTKEFGEDEKTKLLWSLLRH